MSRNPRLRSLAARSLLLSSSLLGLAGAAAPTETPPIAGASAEALTVERIMARDWIGTSPEEPYWSDDGRSIYFSQRRPRSDVKDLHRVDLGSDRNEVVEPRALAAADHPGVWSRDRRIKAWVRDGDVWAKDSARAAPRQLTRTIEEESAPLPLADGRIAFRRGDAYFAVDLGSGRAESLAEIRFAKDPEAKEEPEGFLEEQQRRLFRVLQERTARRDETRENERAQRAADASRPPRPFYFADDRALVDADLSPSGRHLLVAIGPKREPTPYEAEGAEGGKPDDMAVFVTESGYVETRKVRPKVGSGKPESPKLLLLELTTGSRRELDLAVLPGLNDDPLAELRALAKSARERKTAEKPRDTASAQPEPARATDESKPTPRPLRLDGIRWSDDGLALAIQLLSYDNKDRWIATVGLADGAVATLYRQSDPAWLGWRFTSFGWTRDARAVWYLSEDTGFSHLYLQSVAGGERRALTQGPFEVDRPLQARDGKSFFLSANREQAGTYEAYRVRTAGGALERLTSTGGMTYAIPSLDEKQLLLTSSWSTKPPELFVQPARADATAKRLTRTTTPEFDAISWTAPEIVEIPSRHFAGAIQARVYDVPHLRPANGAPAVVFIHGAGYLQNAHAGWSSYFREFMFHTLLARRGYLVLDLDYRASSGYGRNHRTAIYRQMGWPEVEDLADGVAWLVEKRGVDPERVGTYGGSYGGFLTFMAMFRQPELFAAGAALRPVTDWAHYNHAYTSAILNTPEVDPEAFNRSSPIEYADGLAKPLLICHGMLDDNVTFQDSVRLVERLIELGKTDLFETAIYPVEPHGFKEPASWTDEYKRILKLFETHLK